MMLSLAEMSCDEIKISIAIGYEASINVREFMYLLLSGELSVLLGKKIIFLCQ